MDDPRESKVTPSSGSEVASPQAAPKDDADAAIAWYMSDEFEEHLTRCFGEAKKEAIEARERFLQSLPASSGEHRS
jgi:hypothetical protein